MADFFNRIDQKRPFAIIKIGERVRSHSRLVAILRLEGLWETGADSVYLGSHDPLGSAGGSRHTPPPATSIADRYQLCFDSLAQPSYSL